LQGLQYSSYSSREPEEEVVDSVKWLVVKDEGMLIVVGMPLLQRSSVIDIVSSQPSATAAAGIVLFWRGSFHMAPFGFSLGPTTASFVSTAVRRFQFFTRAATVPVRRGIGRVAALTTGATAVAVELERW